ncbi:hypothetical protein CUN63_07510 [Pseudomonas sp. ACM7]|nr:hypothetical protein CUN63_07510 [Pseudomonas sp. ACM7]
MLSNRHDARLFFLPWSLFDNFSGMPLAKFYVGAAEGCDLLIFSAFSYVKNQKIAAFGSSYQNR